MQTELPTADPTRPPTPLPEALRAALERRGYTELTAVQRAVGALAAGRTDLQISSQTGSGKTVALGMLLAQRLFEGGPEGGAGAPRALVITPTRELAAQVQVELAWLYADLPAATVEVVTGGTSVAQEKRALRRHPGIVVGTPGRLLDHIKSGALDCSAVGEVVLDEADQMLDMGFREELEGILDATPGERGTHLVSATFPPGIQRLAERYQRDPRQVQGTRLGEANGDIEHVVHLVFGQDRYSALVNLLLLAGHQRTLVFVNTRRDTAELAERLARDGFSALPLSGELEQTQRTRTLTAFRDGVVNVLVATDVAARGLDIPEVDTVIQAGTPSDGDVYTHRSGRTGRAGRKGRSVLLVPTPYEGRVRRLLSGAGIDASWCDIPGAERVRKKLAKRGRRTLLQAIDASEKPDEGQLEFARLLLEGRDPVQLVARLATLATPPLAREPMEIEAPRADAAERGARAVRSLPPGRRPQVRPARGPREHVRFSINWGVRDGATPRRVLAVVCRRGAVPGRVIGAIRPGPHATTFEIDSRAAADFETRARRPDARDPKLSIRRA